MHWLAGDQERGPVLMVGNSYSSRDILLPVHAGGLLYVGQTVKAVSSPLRLEVGSAAGSPPSLSQELPKA